MTAGPSRGGLRAWAGGALVTAALLAFGLVRPDDGSVRFFVLLALAAVGYLATLHQSLEGTAPFRDRAGRLRRARAGLASPHAARAARARRRPASLPLGRPPRPRGPQPLLR